MIAKHVPMRLLGKSDFAGLVNYVTDAQNKDHRLGQVQITNCDAVSVRDAITEILATQQALLQDNFSATRKPDVPGVGKVPPPVARAGRLRSLAQAEALQIEGAAAAVTPQRPAPAPTPAPSELVRRKAKLQAELNAKKDRPNQRKGRGR